MQAITMKIKVFGGMVAMVLLSFLMAATGYCFDINRYTNEYGEVISPTDATIPEEERGLSLYIDSDASASLQEGDVFNVTYREKGTVEEASFSYDAYECAGHSKPKECVIHIPNGEYEIISVEYTGTNPYILSQGYMVKKEFSVYEDEKWFHFFVGLLDEEINYIGNKEEYDLSTFLVYDPSGQITGTASTSPKVTRSKEELESASIADKVKEMFSQESKNQGEVLEKRYTSESNEDTLVNNINSLLKKLGISAVIMLLGLLVILILKKTGKVK